MADAQDGAEAQIPVRPGTAVAEGGEPGAAGRGPLPAGGGQADGPDGPGALQAPADAAALGEAEAIAPLGGLFARLAGSRLAPIFGAGEATAAGLAAEAVPAGAARTTGVLSLDGEPAGWVRAALDPGAGAAGKALDRRALGAWLDGVGAALGQLLGGAAQLRLVQAGDRPEAAGEAPEGPVLEFGLAFNRRSGTAWLWMEPRLLQRCAAALADSGEGSAAEVEGQAPSSAEAQVRGAAAADGPVPADADPFPPLPETAVSGGGEAIEVLLDVPLQVSVELGSAERQIREILALVPGSVIELDRLAGDPLDVRINGKRIARGEVVVVDERFAVRLTEILTPEERIERML